MRTGRRPRGGPGADGGRAWGARDEGDAVKLGIVFFAIAAAATMTGCSGSRTRTPAEWRDELAPEIDARSGSLTACYEKSGLGKSAKDEDRRALVVVEFVGYREKELLVTLDEEPAFHSESRALTDCVLAALKGIPVPPDDTHRGYGSWWFVFEPGKTSASAAASAPSKAGS